MSVSAMPTAMARQTHLNRRDLPLRPGGRVDGSIGFVSTFPPTKCGLATFTASLARALSGSARTGVVSCVDEPGLTPGSPEVIAEWVRGSDSSLTGAVRALDRFDAVIVQHEFGLFGGDDGEDILELLEELTAPVVVVLHTVLEHPSSNQRRIIEELGRVSHSLVVQSEVARDRLITAHDVDPLRVEVIQHGAPANLAPPALPVPGRRPVILTWGLLGPGKGIEHAIEALALLRDLDPLPRYVVLGETHPNIVRNSGEVYRESLQALAAERGVDHMVEFEVGYRDTTAILAELSKADVVLLPYLSRDQVVSGVLVEAIASAKPVVATAFPHAIELLGQGSGIVVPHEDPVAIAAALRTLLTDPDAAALAAAVARRQAVSLSWENVGARYRQLVRSTERASVVSTR
jgi:polysaccharide biosynthesis protein PslF